jgi:histidinol phosphatase-like enzyme
MIAEIENHGARIDGIYYCTALSEKDIRRKPGCGMFLDILHDFPDIERERCLMIGDSESDVMFAMNSGIRGVKV